jgi:hypothetical protein
MQASSRPGEFPAREKSLVDPGAKSMVFPLTFREAGGSINDMKDMLASLPQFQETRDKVSVFLPRGSSYL